MNALLYLLLLVTMAAGTVVGTYQLPFLTQLFSNTGNDQLLKQGIIVGAILMGLVLSVVIARRPGKGGSSGKVDGTLCLIGSLAMIGKIALLINQVYLEGKIEVMAAALLCGYILLCVGMICLGVYMYLCGQSTLAGFSLAVLAWPITQLVSVVTGKNTYLHNAGELLTVLALLTGCIFYLNLCSQWCVDDTNKKNKKTTAVGLFHVVTFAMAYLPSQVLLPLQGNITFTEGVDISFCIAYLLCLCSICFYLRGNAMARQNKALRSSAEKTEFKAEDFDKTQAVSDFFAGRQQENIAIAKTEDSEAEIKVENKDITAKTSSVKVERAEEKEPPFVAYRQSDLDKLNELMEKSYEKKENDPIDDILQQVKDTSEKNMVQTKEPYVYRAKKSNKNGGRFKK